MSLYVVSDIHSYYEPLMSALTQAGFYEDTESKLLVLGDALDRGPDSRKVVELLGQLHNEGRLIYVTGNHEDLLVQCLQAISRGEVEEIAAGMSHHYTNGTFDSLLQLSGMTAGEAVSDPQRLIRTVMQSTFYRELLPSCVDYYESGAYIFCHGWIPTLTEGYGPFVNYIYNEHWREASVDEWRKARWFNGLELACRFHILEPQKTIVCGHWHASWGHSHINHSGSEWKDDAVFTPFCANGIIAIDACTACTNTVNCIRIDE